MQWSFDWNISKKQNWFIISWPPVFFATLRAIYRKSATLWRYSKYPRGDNSSFQLPCWQPTPQPNPFFPSFSSLSLSNDTCKHMQTFKHMQTHVSLNNTSLSKRIFFPMELFSLSKTKMTLTFRRWMCQRYHLHFL